MRVQKVVREARAFSQVSLSSILHLLAFASFLLAASRIPNRTELFQQLPPLCGLSLLLSLLSAFLGSLSARTIAISVRLLIICIIAYGLGPDLGVQLLLMISIISDAMFSLKMGGYLAISMIAIPIAVAIRQPVSVWNSANAGMAASDRLLLAVILTLVALLCAVLKRSWRREEEQREKLERLDGAVKSLSEANQGFQQYAVLAQERAAQTERNRISREVHDAVGYAMTNILMMARVGKRLIEREPEKLAELFDNIFGQAQEGLNEMRSALRTLRAENSRPVQGMGAVHRLIRAFETSTGVRVRVDYTNVRWAGGGELDRLIFRFIQEGMTNAFRHGHASEIHISFWQEADLLHLRISDNGRGGASSSQGIGLTGMRERIEEQGGTLETRSSRHGFSVVAQLPIAAGMQISADAAAAGR